MSAEKRPKSAGKKAISMTEEKPKNKVGKLAEKPAGVQPTRPLTAYIFFSNEEVPKIVKSQGVSHKDAMRICGGKWNELKDDQKAPYMKKHEQDKLRYGKLEINNFIGTRLNSKSSRPRGTS